MILYICVFLILFFLMQAFVLFCCLLAGNDPLYRRISDQEQLEYLAMWNETHRHANRRHP